MCIVIVIDYCQNLEMPSFRKDQPGETYYFTPMTVPAFGIVDCNSKDNTLYCYIYSEAEGNKGGNAVASLIMKYLEEQNLLDGNKRGMLSVVCDNCPGQNKNNHVLRLAPYLVEKGYFGRVQFVFLVAGHTKNQADRRFNNMKETYHKKNLFTLDKLVEACNESSFVEAKQVFWQDFYDYKSYFDSLYDKCEAVLRYQHFYSTDQKDIGVLYFRTSDDPELSNEYNQNIIKKKWG